MLDEFNTRYRHKHSFEKYREILKAPPKNIRIGNLEEFAQAMPDKYKNKDSVVAYRNYFCGEKLNKANWSKGREMPDWIQKSDCIMFEKEDFSKIAEGCFSPISQILF